jgi:predicted SprT family Zn-dependent metalloprotease
LAILFKEHESILNAAHSSTVTNAIKESEWKEIAKQVSAVEGRNSTVAEVKRKKKNLKSSAKNKEVSNRTIRNWR